MPHAFLATYRPLCRRAAGRQAIVTHQLLPYIDGSCRREPDLELELPTITALCRGAMFAPRLDIGDRVAYVTKRGKYGGASPHWRLAALLHVSHRFETHADAAAWYGARFPRLPRNCMVAGNGPVPLDQTDGKLTAELRDVAATTPPSVLLRALDRGYAARARRYPIVLACQPLFRELRVPPVISREDWERWCDGVPSTQTPPMIDENVWAALCERAGIAH